MRYRDILAVVCCLGATACADRPTRTLEPAPQFQPVTAASCPTPAAMEVLIRAVVPAGTSRSQTMLAFDKIVKLVSPTRPGGPNLSEAQVYAFALVKNLVAKYDAGALIGGQSASTQATLEQLLNGILCTAGLPPAFGSGSLSDDGSAAFIYPSTQETTVVTETQWAGVIVPAGSVTQPTIVTIQRLPDSPGPLFTNLDQYPIFYEYHSSPAMPFTQDLVVGVCVASNFTPPDPLRLRLAHNVAPFTPGSIEILPIAPAPFIDCSNSPIASAARSRGFDLARVGAGLRRGLGALLLPQRLLALPYYATGGVGGTVKTFSPFGAVDTLGDMTGASRIEFHGDVNGAPIDGLPSVIIRTPTGVPMAGVQVIFSIGSGGASLTGGNTVTDASGIATVGSLRLGPVRGCSTIWATATMPAGAGLTGNPVSFEGCAR